MYHRGLEFIWDVVLSGIFYTRLALKRQTKQKQNQTKNQQQNKTNKQQKPPKPNKSKKTTTQNPTPKPSKNSTAAAKDPFGRVVAVTQVLLIQDATLVGLLHFV